MHVLVAYGSKMGGTAGIAELVGQALTDAGFQADVRPISEVDRLEAYDAVLVGGALYSGRWHREARRFVKRHTGALRSRPVWLFSSGPLNGSAAEAIPPVPQVRELLERIGARGHVTFGGRLAADAKGFPASAMARRSAGDWRDPRRSGAGPSRGRWSWCRLTCRSGCMPNQSNQALRGAPWP